MASTNSALPIGKIRWLDIKAGCDIGQMEFTCLGTLQKKMEESAFYGAPFMVMVYEENAPDFRLPDYIDIANLRGVAMVPNPHLHPKPEWPSDPMEQAKLLISEFCEEHYGNFDPSSFDTPDAVGVGYTTVTDKELPIQAYVNLIDFSIERYLCETLIERRKYSNVQELVNAELMCLDEDELLSVSDNELKMLNE